MEGYNYDRRSRTVKVEDITTDDTNRDILRRLKENDPDFDELWVCQLVDRVNTISCFCPDGTHGLGWLGYFVG